MTMPDLYFKKKPKMSSFFTWEYCVYGIFGDLIGWIMLDKDDTYYFKPNKNKIYCASLEGITRKLDELIKIKVDKELKRWKKNGKTIQT